MVKVYAIEGVIPVVHPTAFVHPSAVLIGDVVIGPETYIGPNASLRGDLGELRVGRGANLQDCVVMHSFPKACTVVEDWGHIGHGAVLHGCTIGRNALVGMNAVVMDGAEVGDSALVGACAFVKAGFRLPARMVAAGAPAKIVRELSDDEIRWKERGTREYHTITRRARASMVAVEALTEIEPDRPSLQVEAHYPLHETRQRQAAGE
ncbi:MAG: phenylacetic acid degradation protein PaaY [Rhodospirillales bacterium]